MGTKYILFGILLCLCGLAAATMNFMAFACAAGGLMLGLTGLFRDD